MQEIKQLLQIIKNLQEKYIKTRKLKHYKETFYTLSPGILKRINEQVPLEDKL